MKQYLITTPNNPAFKGKTLGVRFENGQAVLSEFTLPKLGRTMEQVLRALKKDFHYEVRILKETPAEVSPTEVEEVAEVPVAVAASEGVMAKRKGGRPRKAAENAQPA